ncbi:SWI4 [Candida theae]|uniref:Transcription factor MBP1 n=1 Tax=Candida theae TaxID=1198502 RepID=A0AAD5BH58_9ASCO|nr:SWI4 [Candida theae]KAI5962827.1 SWI4 [Candida theae]
MSGPPPVVRAIYSNTEVYECDMNDSPIMRRCKDDWVNATQILKCCNFPKAKRTKILEKGVQQGLHEKVQGGFGRFQGTWIPLEDARRLAHTYGVTRELAPVLFLDFNDPNLVIPVKAKPPPKESTNLIKRKYIKKSKQPGDTPKKYKTGKKAALQQAAAAAGGGVASADISMGELQPSAHSSFISQDANGTHSRSNSFIAPPNSYPQGFINGQQTARKSLPHPVPQQFDHMALTPHSAGTSFSQPEYPPFNGSNSLPSSQNGYPNSQLISRFQQFQPQQFPQMYPQQNSNVRQFPIPIPNPIPPQVYAEGKVLSSQSSNESNWSLHNDQKESDTSITSSMGDRKSFSNGSQLPQDEPTPGDDNSYSAQLLKFFSEDSADIPYFVHNPPSDFNINEPIDDEGHTPLHWAASIGNYEMIHTLISKGANPLIVNNFGLNPLSKLISFNNCYELRNFDKVLNDLELCLINTDINGRTPLHYLCQFAKVKSKFESLQSYLNSILTKLQVLTNQSQTRSVNLLKNVLNHQDVRGDTCLHIAIKSGCSNFAQILIKYGARDDIENIDRQTARGLIVQYNIIPNYTQIDSAQEAYQTQLSMGYYEPRNSARSLQDQQASAQGLATPIQPSFHRVETPDTQRTTVQDDDVEEDDEPMARVDSRHLEALNDDDKENIFVEKRGDNMSPPTVHRNQLNSVHQPLAVISEIEAATAAAAAAASSPSSISGTQHPAMIQHSPLPPAAAPHHTHHSIASQQIGHDKITQSSRRIFTKPNPPKLDDEGKIVQKEESDKSLPLEDLSVMITGMIGSFSGSYKEESSRLDKHLAQLKSSFAEKQSETNKSLKYIKKLFRSSGIELETNEFNTIEEAQSIVNKHIQLCQQSITENEFRVTNIMQRSQAFDLASLVQKEERATMDLKSNGHRDHEDDDHEDDDDDDDDDGTSDLVNEEKFDMAVELTQYQLQRTKLVNEIAKSTKMFGIDDTMYKYRKLLSLSCGVRVEDIDSLIDGIAESLAEGR